MRLWLVVDQVVGMGLRGNQKVGSTARRTEGQWGMRSRRGVIVGSVAAILAIVFVARLVGGRPGSEFEFGHKLNGHVWESGFNMDDGFRTVPRLQFWSFSQDYQTVVEELKRELVPKGWVANNVIATGRGGLSGWEFNRSGDQIIAIELHDELPYRARVTVPVESTWIERLRATVRGSDSSP